MDRRQLLIHTARPIERLLSSMLSKEFLASNMARQGWQSMTHALTETKLMAEERMAPMQGPNVWHTAWYQCKAQNSCQLRDGRHGDCRVRWQSPWTDPNPNINPTIIGWQGP